MKSAAEIKITRADERDFSEILELQKLAFRENALRYNDFTITPLTQTLEELAAQAKDHVILKAADGGRIVGTVRGCLKNGYCSLGKLCVHPDYQNQGIGRRLIAAIESEFGSVTFRFVTGYLDEKNIALYQKLGYRIYQSERIPGDPCSVFMEKKPSKERRIDMNITVLYRSITGHSKKIARAVAAELGVEARDVKAKPGIRGADLAFIVGGLYSGRSLPEMTAYLQTLTPDNVKKAVLITSSVSDKTGQDEARRILTANGVEVASAEYRCGGNFLFIKMGHPNKREIAEAVAFAKGFI
ncbi:MAG: GNAT family N-acetyltransferase [Firmicutes bacterium]|nr:GNAT family N-acetyltransferase [Bacillota bacterium]